MASRGYWNKFCNASTVPITIDSKIVMKYVLQIDQRIQQNCYKFEALKFVVEMIRMNSQF